jgi:putative membrane protein
MKHVLSPEEQANLAQQVAEVERNTAGELVTVVIAGSSRYAAFRLGWAAVLALLAACAAHLIWPGLVVAELLGGQALLGFLLVAVLGWPALLRIIVPSWLKQQAVDEHAKRLFLELGLTETTDRSGILILLSELERRVVILGDRGIHRQLGDAAWKALVAELVQSIRAGSAAAGLSSIIERLGKELAMKFPPRPGDTDELPNAVIIDRTRG